MNKHTLVGGARIRTRGPGGMSGVRKPSKTRCGFYAEYMEIKRAADACLVARQKAGRPM